MGMLKWDNTYSIYHSCISLIKLLSTISGIWYWYAQVCPSTFETINEIHMIACSYFSVCVWNFFSMQWARNRQNTPLNYGVLQVAVIKPFTVRLAQPCTVLLRWVSRTTWEAKHYIYRFSFLLTIHLILFQSQSCKDYPGVWLSSPILSFVTDMCPFRTEITSMLSRRWS